MCTEKCKKWFSLATSAIGVILGVSAFVVLFCIYKNYDAGLWAILSAVLAGVAFHLNYLHLKEKLDLWHSPETLDSIKGLGTMTLIGGLTGVIWYIFIALYKSIPILPVSNSAAIMAVWAFMMAKWGLVLILYGNKYIHIVATSHRSLIDQAVTSHRPLIDQAVTSHRPLIDQAVTSHRPLIDQAVTSHRPLIDQAVTSHRPLIDQAVTSHRSLIDQAVTSHRSLIDQAVTSHRPLINQAVTSHRPLIEA